MLSHNNSLFITDIICVRNLITRSIQPAVAPPLVHFAAVELGLADLYVDFIVDAAEPI